MSCAQSASNFYNSTSGTTSSLKTIFTKEGELLVSLYKNKILIIDKCLQKM